MEARVNIIGAWGLVNWMTTLSRFHSLLNYCRSVWKNRGDNPSPVSGDNRQLQNDNLITRVMDDHTNTIPEPPVTGIQENMHGK